MKIVNVTDRRNHWIGEWEATFLDYDMLADVDVGRTVIYSDPHKRYVYRNELGVISSFRDDLVFVKFHSGSTAAACEPARLLFGLKPLDGDLTR